MVELKRITGNISQDKPKKNHVDALHSCQQFLSYFDTFYWFEPFISSEVIVSCSMKALFAFYKVQ